jgi:hypothetical protein
MVWSHYANESDLSITEQAKQLDEYAGHGIELHYQDWITWYSDDLRNMWVSLSAYRKDALVKNHILNMADFNTFCEFCYFNSSKTQNKIF